MTAHHTFTQRLVTPAQAQQWLTNNLFDKQRALRPYHVAYLTMLMQHGHFRHGTTITFAVCGKKHYLINGQHTLHALINHGQALPLTLEDCPCATMADVATLYATYDRNLARSQSDILNAYGFAEQYGLSKTQVNALAAAMPYILDGFAEESWRGSGDIGLLLRNTEARHACMQQWAPEMQKLSTLIKGCSNLTRSFLERAAVLAVALITLRYQAPRASVFWQEVAFDEGLTSGMPSKALLRWLVDHPVKFLRGPGYGRYVAAAWNAHHEGRMLHKLYQTQAPIVLAGTPHVADVALRYVDAQGMPTREAVVLKGA